MLLRLLIGVQCCNDGRWRTESSIVDVKTTYGMSWYSSVKRHQPDIAGKITGMMLEMDQSYVMKMLEDEVLLEHKAREALKVLQLEHNKQQASIFVADASLTPSSAMRKAVGMDSGKDYELVVKGDPHC